MLLRSLFSTPILAPGPPCRSWYHSLCLHRASLLLTSEHCSPYRTYHPQPFAAFIHHLVAFINAHLVLRRQNRVLTFIVSLSHSLILLILTCTQSFVLYSFLANILLSSSTSDASMQVCVVAAHVKLSRILYPSMVIATLLIYVLSFYLQSSTLRFTTSFLARRRTQSQG